MTRLANARLLGLLRRDRRRVLARATGRSEVAGACDDQPSPARDLTDRRGQCAPPRACATASERRAPQPRSARSRRRTGCGLGCRRRHDRPSRDDRGLLWAHVSPDLIAASCEKARPWRTQPDRRRIDESRHKRWAATAGPKRQIRALEAPAALPTGVHSAVRPSAGVLALDNAAIAHAPSACTEAMSDPSTVRDRSASRSIAVPVRFGLNARCRARMLSGFWSGRDAQGLQKVQIRECAVKRTSGTTRNARVDNSGWRPARALLRLRTTCMYSKEVCD